MIQQQFITKVHTDVIIPKKVDIYNWIDRLRITMNKEKDKAKKARIKIMIEEFETLKDSL